MKTPSFWHHRNMISSIVAPISWIYYLITKILYQYHKPHTLPIPVLCIGNITAGGSGKTPVAIHLGDLCKQHGIRAFFLSRGYGGYVAGPVLVNPKTHSAQEVGDEPLLLARTLPTIVSKDRIAGAQLALEHGATALIMDDGFQNPRLHKDASVLVIDGLVGQGNGRLIPAGPLRETLTRALTRANAVILLNPRKDRPFIPPAIPTFIGHTQLSSTLTKGHKVLAFCGLAYPEKFFSSLHDVGLNIAQTVAFADHHPYTQKEIASLFKQAEALGASLVTTSKDAIRLPESVRKNVFVVEMSLQFDKDAQLEQWLIRTVKKNA